MGFKLDVGSNFIMVVGLSVIIICEVDVVFEFIIMWLLNENELFNNVNKIFLIVDNLSWVNL